MCLSAANVKQTPFRKSTTRWKIVFKNDETGELTSPCIDMSWNVGQTYKARARKEYADKVDVGFHVFVTRSTARDVCDYWQSCFAKPGKRYVVVKVEISGFVAAGYFTPYTNDTKSETWKKCKIVKVSP